MTLIFFFSNDINANLWQFLKPTWNINRSPVWRRHYLSRQISEGFLNIFFLIFKQKEGSCRTISFVPSIEVLIFFIMSVVVFLNCWHNIPWKTSIVSRFGRQSVGRQSADCRPTQTSSLQPFDSRATTNRLFTITSFCLYGLVKTPNVNSLFRSNFSADKVKKKYV